MRAYKDAHTEQILGKFKDLKSKFVALSLTAEKQGENIKDFDANSARLKGLLASQKRLTAKKTSLIKSMETKLNTEKTNNSDLQAKLNAAKRKNWEDRRRMEESMAQMTRQLQKKSKHFDSLKAKFSACKTSKKSIDLELESLQEKYYEMRKDHRKQMASVAQDLSKARLEHYPENHYFIQP